MRRLLVTCLCFTAVNCYSISPEEANKFVDKYDTAQKKILGFINCVTRVLTGEDAVTPTETKDSRGIVAQMERPSNLEGCFNLVGFKMGAGFSKLTSMFSKGGTAPSSLNGLDQVTNSVRDELLKEKAKQGNTVTALQPNEPPQGENLLAKDRVPAAQPVKVQPSAPVRIAQPQEKRPSPQANQSSPGKVKTAW